MPINTGLKKQCLRLNIFQSSLISTVPKGKSILLITELTIVTAAVIIDEPNIETARGMERSEPKHIQNLDIPRFTPLSYQVRGFEIK
jgi:hypothetical protein